MYLFIAQGDGRQRQGSPISLLSCENLSPCTNSGLPLGFSKYFSPVFSMKGVDIEIVRQWQLPAQTLPERK